MSAGIKAARALLSLIEENSAEDFEAAESVLGAEQNLVHILELLRRYKDQGEEPFGLAQLRGIVRREVLGLGLPSPVMIEIIQVAMPFVLRTPTSRINTEEALAQALHRLEAEASAPHVEVTALLELLRQGFQAAGQEAKLLPLLRPLAIRALVENTAMFPTLRALAALRAHWAHGDLGDLPYQAHESRRRVATRLCADAEDLDPAGPVAGIVLLLQQGMRGPGDGAIAAMRRMKPKKAHGGGQG
jgi:hypothetical protein